MSRRLSERALPDFSQLIDGSTQLPLSQCHQGASGGEFHRQFAVGVPPRIGLGRLWLLSYCHLAQDAAARRALSSRTAIETSGEGGVAC